MPRRRRTATVPRLLAVVALLVAVVAGVRERQVGDDTTYGSNDGMSGAASSPHEQALFAYLHAGHFTAAQTVLSAQPQLLDAKEPSTGASLLLVACRVDVAQLEGGVVLVGGESGGAGSSADITPEREAAASPHSTPATPSPLPRTPSFHEHALVDMRDEEEVIAPAIPGSSTARRLPPYHARPPATATPLPRLHHLSDRRSLTADTSATADGDASPSSLALDQLQFVRFLVNSAYTALGGNVHARRSLIPSLLIHARDKFGVTALHEAAWYGAHDVLSYLLSEAVANDRITAVDESKASSGHAQHQQNDTTHSQLDLDVRESLTGKTALALACLRGNLPVARLLIAHNASPFALDADRAALVHLAAASGALDMLRYVVEELGMDVLAVDGLGRTAVHRAVMGAGGGSSVVKMVVYLMERGADVRARDGMGRGVLHWACIRGHFALVRYLIMEVGMLPNARDAHGRTPLIHAARSPGPATAAIMRTLLRSGADIDWQDMFGRSALHETVLQRGRLAVSDGVHAAEAASSDHDSNVDVDETTSILLFLLHRDANPDLQDANGDTPLHYAARYAAISDARALLRAHASSTLLNRNGHAPLHVAEIHAHNTTVVRFLALGMDVNIVTSTGATVLHFAIWEGRVAMALTLMRLGARVDACDIAGMTPLHVAAAATFPASTEILDELLRRGADVQAVDRHARTPLIQAVMVGNVRAVHTLLAARGGVAVVNKADWLGRTALHHAAVGGSVLMVEVLLVHGADPGVCDSRGQRAVDLLPRRSNTTASDRAATRLRSLLRVNSIPITTSSNGSLPPPLTLTSPPRKLHRTIAHRILSADTHCSVCMDPLYTHDAAVPDGCARHVFHRRCLMRWYEQVARANVDANAGADDGGRRRRVMAPCPGCRTPFGKAYVITM